MLLVTGFEAFGPHTTNPTEQLVRRVEAGAIDGASGLCLPVSYQRAFPLLEQALRHRRPHTVLALGLSARAPGIVLEQLARNENGASADNDGLALPGLIEQDAPPTLPSTLPLDDIEQSLTRASFVVERSTDAGGYLCNHLFYRLARLASREGLRAGFVHVPPEDTLSPARLLEAVQLMALAISHHAPRA